MAARPSFDARFFWGLRTQILRFYPPLELSMHALIASCLSLALMQPLQAFDGAPDASAAATARPAQSRITFDGKQPPAADRDVLRERLQEALRRAEFDARSCPEGACPQSADTWVIDVHVVEEGPDFRLKLRATPPGGADAPIEEEAVCEICGIEELGESIEGLATRLRSKADHLTSPTTLSVQSTPPGAAVEVDGEPVGTTPLSIEVAPGPHVLRVSKPGYAAQEQEAELTAGATQTFTYRLAPKAFVPAWLPWTLLGAGVASLGTGIALLALHDRPIRSECNADVMGNCQYLHRTLGGGIAFTITGLAATAAGVGLAVVRRRQVDVQPVAARDYGGVVVTGRF